jgi:hypothetical protein
MADAAQLHTFITDQLAIICNMFKTTVKDVVDAGQAKANNAQKPKRTVTVKKLLVLH